MTETRDQFTIGRTMVLVAAIALVFAGVTELVGDGGQRVMLALGPGSPWVLHLAFALILLLWWLAAIHLFQSLVSGIGGLASRIAREIEARLPASPRRAPGPEETAEGSFRQGEVGPPGDQEVEAP